MPSLTGPRNTLRMGIESVIQLLSVPVKAQTVIQQGTLVVAEQGLAVPGRADKGLRALGRAERKADNASGPSGGARAEVLRGTFRWDNDPNDPISPEDLFATCYVTDDHTVCRTDGGGARSPAGKVIQVDPEGVWVETT